jgi:hypothetical protein
MLLRSALFAISDSRLPLVYDGGGWSTELTLVNLGAVDVTIRFTFATEKVCAEEWKIVFRSSFGQPKDSVIATTMKPGATLTTDGPASGV